MKTLYLTLKHQGIRRTLALLGMSMLADLLRWFMAVAGNEELRAKTEELREAQLTAWRVASRQFGAW